MRKKVYSRPKNDVSAGQSTEDIVDAGMEDATEKVHAYSKIFIQNPFNSRRPVSS
jgi:hypothetical protein